MIKEKTNYILSNKRFVIVIGILIFMWVLLIGFFYLKLDEVTKGPCGICAEINNQEITFSQYGYSEQHQDYITVVRIYYPNGSSTTKILDFELNLTGLE